MGFTFCSVLEVASSVRFLLFLCLTGFFLGTAKTSPPRLNVFFAFFLNTFWAVESTQVFYAFSLALKYTAQFFSGKGKFYSFISTKVI